MQISPNDKFIEIFAQRFHYRYIEDPFYKFFALNLLFLDTSYNLALKYSSFLFKFFSLVFYNINFWFKISKISVLLNTARNYKVLKTVQRTTRYYKELQDTSNEVQSG